MQAIATLVLDDPYLKMTAQQRCDARRERKGRLFSRAIESVFEIVEVPVDKTQRVELPIEPEPTISEPDPVDHWAERQKAVWFSIVDEIDEGGKKKIKIKEIQHAICEYFGVTRTDLLSHRRMDLIVHPRQIAMYLSKALTRKSLPEIGRRFGGKDHTTVLHAVRKVEALVQSSEETRDDVARLKLSLGVA